MKHAISTRWLANPHWSRRHFPHNVWSSYECFIHYQSEDFVVIQVPPSFMLTIKPRKWFCYTMSTYSSLFYTHDAFLVICYRSHIPLTYRYPHRNSNRIRVVCLKRLLSKQNDYKFSPLLYVFTLSYCKEYELSIRTWEAGETLALSELLITNTMATAPQLARIRPDTLYPTPKLYQHLYFNQRQQ